MYSITELREKVLSATLDDDVSGFIENIYEDHADKALDLKLEFLLASRVNDTRSTALFLLANWWRRPGFISDSITLFYQDEDDLAAIGARDVLEIERRGQSPAATRALLRINEVTQVQESYTVRDFQRAGLCCITRTA